MYDVANLAIKVDATEAGKAATELDRLGTSSKKTGVTVEQAERYMRKASIQLGDMAKAERDAAKAGDTLTKSTKTASQAASDLANEAMRSAERVNGVAKMSGSASFAARNLSYQLTDVVQGFALGQKPMQIFMQQGFQIADAMGQLAYEAKKADQSLLSMIGGSLGKFGPILAAAGAALAVAAGGVALLTDEVNRNGDVTVTWQDTLLGVYDVVSEAVSDTVTAAFEQMGIDVAQVWDFVISATKGAINQMIAVATAAPRLIIDTYQLIPAAFGDAFYSAAQLAIDAINFLIQKTASGVNALVDIFNAVFGTDIPKAALDGIGDIENPYAGAMSRLGSTAAKSLTESFTTNYFQLAEQTFGDAIRNRALARKAAENAESAGKSAGAKGGAAGGKAMADEWAEALQRHWNEVNKALNDLLGETDKMVKAIMKSSDEDLKRVLEAANDNYSEAAKAAMEAAAAQAHWNDELRQTIDALDGIGRAGQSIGDIGAILYGLQTGDFSGARGPAGYLLQQLSGIQWRTDDGEIKRFGEEVLSALDKVFGGTGTFAQTMNTLLQGAGIGASIGQVAFTNRSSQTGSTIGGSLGAAASKEFFSKALGEFAGPVGAIVGSLLGGLAGDLIRGNEKGRATFSGTGFSVSGDNNSREAAAADLARTVIEAAERVADALGATSVALSGTIGVRNSSIRFNPTGTSLKDGLNFGQDAEAAIKAAIANATFEGLSETFEKLLGSGSDIEDQIDKVLALSAALNEASERADPIGAQIEALNTQFDALRGYLDEGNATAEERAKIEELYSAKLAEINGQTSDAADLADKRRELEIALLTAQGDILGAVAMQREAELDALDESLRPLQEQVYAAQDLAVTRALEIQLMQAMGDEAGAVAAQRQIELSSLTDSQKAIQERIYALNDAREAEQAAAQEAARIAQERVGLETRLLTLQGDVAALRQRELDALDPSNRAIQEQIYALEDLATANAEAARIADEAAAQARAIATEREGLEARLLQLQGDTIALRQREIESVDESNRALVEQIHFEEDRAEALAKIAAYRQREASEAESLQTRLLELQGDTAALRQQELDALIPSNRALLEQIFALEDAADAAAQAAEAERTLAAERDAIANERASLERRILELEGDTAALLALERAAISEGNRVLFDRIQQLEMEADRAEQLRLQTERLASSRAAIEDERYALETRLLQAVGATANLRDRELKLLDPANRKYLEFIYALEDQAAATAEAERAAAELAATEERIANERASLESRLLSLQGDTTALRALELASVDEANRAILELIYSLEDAQAEARAAAEAEEILAAERRAIESERYSLESRLLSLMGDTNAVRARELETVNEVNRSILQQIYALEDQQAAAAAAERAAADAARAQAEADRAAQQALREYESRVNEARNNLSSVYEREARAITEVQDRFQGFAENLRAFRDSLTNRTATGGDYRSAQVEFIKQSALAASGDEGGLAALAGAGNAFLQASLTNASSAVQYQRDVAQVARAVEAAIGAADTAVDYQSAQLEALDAQVMGLIEINQSVQTVAEAIAELEDAMIGGSILGSEPIPVTFAPGGDSGEITALRTEVATLGSKFDRLISAAEKTANESAKTNNSYLSRVVDNDAIRTRAS